MRLLVLHQNFPGQFGHLVRAWAQRPGWEVRALGRDTARGIPGFEGLTRYKPAREPHKHQHPYLRTLESAVLHGQQVARELLAIKNKGFTPDVVLAHPGWGESLYVKDVFPNAHVVHFCEWYYGGEGGDTGFDPEFPVTFDDRARVRTWNALHALNLTHCDAAVTPTQWQKSRHPDIFQPKIVVQHEGIDTQGLGPDPNAAFKTPSGLVLRAGDPVVTYVARNLEPYRGFHIFMRALAQLQRQHKTMHAVIVGGDEVSYGKKPTDAPNWRTKMLQEVQLDPARTHFTGKLPRAQYIQVLQVSAAHVYLTYPFVLSWSLLEAMACGALIVGSDTAPVREVITHGHNGVLVPFFEPAQIAAQVQAGLESPQPLDALRAQTRQAASQFSHDQGLVGYSEIIKAGDWQ
jgi:glycosyltransferase involved in cell wall biosynthesis